MIARPIAFFLDGRLSPQTTMPSSSPVSFSTMNSFSDNALEVRPRFRLTENLFKVHNLLSLIKTIKSRKWPQRVEEPFLDQFVTNSFLKFQISFEFQLRLDIFKSKYCHVYYENSLHWAIFSVVNFHPQYTETQAFKLNFDLKVLLEKVRLVLRVGLKFHIKITKKFCSKFLRNRYWSFFHANANYCP